MMAFCHSKHTTHTYTDGSDASQILATPSTSYSSSRTLSWVPSADFTIAHTILACPCDLFSPHLDQPRAHRTTAHTDCQITSLPHQAIQHNCHWVCHSLSETIVQDQGIASPPPYSGSVRESQYIPNQILPITVENMARLNASFDGPGFDGVENDPQHSRIPSARRSIRRSKSELYMETSSFSHHQPHDSSDTRAFRSRSRVHATSWNYDGPPDNPDHEADSPRHTAVVHQPSHSRSPAGTHSRRSSLLSDTPTQARHHGSSRTTSRIRPHNHQPQDVHNDNHLLRGGLDSSVSNENPTRRHKKHFLSRLVAQPTHRSRKLTPGGLTIIRDEDSRMYWDQPRQRKGGDGSRDERQPPRWLLWLAGGI